MTNLENEDFFKTDAGKAYEAIENKKRESIKRGAKVIHLEYLSPLFLEDDITEFKNTVERVGLQLSHYDKSGKMYASLDTFDLVVYIGIAQPLIGELIKGLAINATWDILKLFILSAWKKIRNQSYFRVTSANSEKKELTFGLKVHLDRNTSINLKLDGQFDESLIEKSLDQVLSFLKELELNSSYKNTDFAYFDKEKELWIKIDVETEIRKMVDKGEINKK